MLHVYLICCENNSGAADADVHSGMHSIIDSVKAERLSCNCEDSCAAASLDLPKAGSYPPKVTHSAGADAKTKVASADCIGRPADRKRKHCLTLETVNPVCA